jgi:hypothetical protein
MTFKLRSNIFNQVKPCPEGILSNEEAFLGKSLLQVIRLQVRSNHFQSALA